jgi:hypothetical protein
MLLKSFRKNGVICWSNSKNNNHLLACASVQPNAQDRYELDILSLDVVEKSKVLPIVGSATYTKPFRCIAWDCFGEREGITHSYGRYLPRWINFWWNGGRYRNSMERQGHFTKRKIRIIGLDWHFNWLDPRIRIAHYRLSHYLCRMEQP